MGHCLGSCVHIVKSPKTSLFTARIASTPRLPAMCTNVIHLQVFEQCNDEKKLTKKLLQVFNTIVREESASVVMETE